MNNLLYNSKTSNLALHGTHPLYQHFVINLPQMLGPAFVLLFLRPRSTIALASGLSGLVCLSLFPHQEARFLLPAIPLFLSTVRLPPRYTKIFVVVWIGFNAILGVMMGIYHQGGVVPAQMFLETQPSVAKMFWWKTYSPPTWLLGKQNEIATTIDLMGLNSARVVDRICSSSWELPDDKDIVLVAPRSALFLDQFLTSRLSANNSGMQLQEIWNTSRHLNLDDMDFGDDGVLPTLQRVLGRRGLVVWKVTCGSINPEAV